MKSPFLLDEGAEDDMHPPALANLHEVSLDVEMETAEIAQAKAQSWHRVRRFMESEPDSAQTE